jgi:hypothetical protein
MRFEADGGIETIDKRAIEQSSCGLADLAVNSRRSQDDAAILHSRSGLLARSAPLLSPLMVGDLAAR